jgi:glycosyltransferase involved in cell wall biosynthesis
MEYKMKKISIIIPIYNEEKNIVELHKEIKAVCDKNKYIYEIIFIDDGSSDNTKNLIKNIAPVKYIQLRKNFGQTAAMDAGIKNAKYDYIVTMDGDRQNDPNDIPNLIKHLEDNDYDVVSGWRKKRKDNFFKRFISRGAHLLRNLIIKDGIHDSGCSLKIYKRECFDNLTLYGEMHRFIPAILKIKGFKIGEIIVNHRPRIAGKTKYSWKRTIKGFIDMIAVWFWNKYAARPLHLMGSLGIILLIISFIFGVYTIYIYIIGKKLHNNIIYPLLTVFFGITGIQLFVSGLISDMLSKNYYGSTKDKSYQIKEIIENKSIKSKKKLGRKK